jgi:hypothetical protein
MKKGWTRDEQGCAVRIGSRLDPFAVPDRTPEAIAQDDRQEADLRSIQAAEQTVCGCWERPAARQGVYCGGNECLMLVPPVREQFDSTYLAALVVIANEPGAGRFARAINLVAAIFGKTSTEVLQDACVIA